MVEVTGLEPAASCSQSRRATNCATPRYSAFQNKIKAGALPLAVPKIFFGKSLENFDRGAAKSSLYPPQEALGFCANCAAPRYSAFQNKIKAGALPLAVPKIFFGKSLENFDRGAAKSSLYPPQEALGFCANCAAPRYLLTALLLYPYNSRLSNFLNNCVHTAQYFFIIIKAEAKKYEPYEKACRKKTS